MKVDVTVLPGLLLLAAELLTLAAVGYVVARAALRQTNDALALAQGLVIGLALWGLTVNFLLHLFPGLAGALAGWIVVLSVGIGLAWRQRHDLAVAPRTIAGFGLAGTAIFWIALASRQLLIIPDEILHTMVPATIRAGGWPPTLGWNPDLALAYHHGPDLLVGLLTPPTGPDLAFTTELLGAYVWTALVLLTAALLLRRGSWAVTLTLLPLLLAHGAWSLVFGEQPTLLQVPVPVGIPEAGVRTAIGEVYWPAVELPWSSEQHAVPPNIWKPQFPLTYALAFVALERIAAGVGRTWWASLTLAALIGFLGLVDETVAPVVLMLWVVVEAHIAWRASPDQHDRLRAILRAESGPVLAAILLAVGGGVITGVLTESAGAGELAVAWPTDPRSRGAVSSILSVAGGLGLLGLGSIVVMTCALVLARRDRLILLLAASFGVFLTAALILRYEAAPHDLARFDGHARNFALLALMLALCQRLAGLKHRWRYAAVVLIAGLVTWPTVAVPARKIGLAVGHGVAISNAQPGPREFGVWYWWMGRNVIERFPSNQIAAWISEYTRPDARVLSPIPHAMTVTTGRPNASGFAQFLHPRPATGPEYLDSIRYLEPAAIKRLGFSYIHAPDSWIHSLPDRARRWLADPELFELLVREGTQALYRVRQGFLQLDVPPTPGAYEALREAIPDQSTVYLSHANGSLNTFRALAVLPQSHLMGLPNEAALHIPNLHLQADVRPTPLQDESADFVVTAAQLGPSMFGPDARRPIFWNEEIAVYAADGAIAPVREPPPRPFTVRLRDAGETDGRLAFTATLSDTSGEGWTGQDWLVVPADESPWALPRIRPTDPAAQWYAGQASPRPGSVTHRYEFDPQAVTLGLRDSPSDTVKLDSSGDRLGPGMWILAVRLRSEYQLSGFIPVVKVVVAESGNVSYEAYEGRYGVKPSPRPSEP